MTARIDGSRPGLLSAQLQTCRLCS